MRTGQLAAELGMTFADVAGMDATEVEELMVVQESWWAYQRELLNRQACEE